MTKEAEQVEKDIKNNEEPEFQICEDCKGEGQVIAHERIRMITLDVPYKYCPECQGRGVK
jgi:DnaJ-class molecular chaperone